MLETGTGENLGAENGVLRNNLEVLFSVADGNRTIDSTNGERDGLGLGDSSVAEDLSDDLVNLVLNMKHFTG